MKIIHFNQASKQSSEKEVFEATKLKFQSLATDFTKSTLLQFAACDIWESILDLTPYWASGDYSQMLLDKTNQIFNDFEELQKNNILEDTKKVIIEAIKRANKNEQSRNNIRG